jgi:hypothetical protein
VAFRLTVPRVGSCIDIIVSGKKLMFEENFEKLFFKEAR